MPKYLVTIKAVITKQYKVEADDAYDADEKAHELFNPNRDGTAENYDQYTDDVREIQPSTH